MYPRANKKDANEISQREMCWLGYLQVIFLDGEIYKEGKFKWEIDLGFSIESLLVIPPSMSLFFCFLVFILCYLFVILCMEWKQTAVCQRISFTIWYAVLLMKSSYKDSKWAFFHSYHLPQMCTLKSESRWERIKSPNCHTCVCVPQTRKFWHYTVEIIYFWEHSWQTESCRYIEGKSNWVRAAFPH